MIFSCFLLLGIYCHVVGVTKVPTSHGYIPMGLFAIHTFLYGVGPLRVTVNYLQALTNESNIFIGRLIYSSITWLSVFISTSTLPLLVDYIGAGWVFWYMSIVCSICYILISYFLPDLECEVIYLNELECEPTSPPSIEENI